MIENNHIHSYDCITYKQQYSWLYFISINSYLDKPISDVCSLPKVVGPCRAAFRKYFYNKKTGRCERFIYGGCGGNKNNFATLQKCKEACDKPNSDVCSLPKVVGPCRAAFRSYFYNKKTGRCERFIYGGCGGNKNKFATLQKCKEACDKPNANVCSLPKVVGPCRAAFRRYFYNKKTGHCERFIYGGCGGNKNNFKTLQKCKETCGN
ncbi:hypothetical protein FSP39_013863 [Pinctada imbricata]|uniref:BPTI/Kunitz inhibitor domain-containing protein n=1 Tax=Pinctada imbricata TaxID=66713 RepID=A0AA89BKI7_PINIB|nr:hypothetical protein FSP39_013863 [Pinctada imbricata]